MPSLSRYSDPAMNTFKKTNMYYESDPFIKYQDPTYIGFKLFFLFNQDNAGLLSTEPLKNTAMGYLTAIGDTVRVEYLSSFLKLLRRINEETPWFFQSIEGLDEAWKHMYHEKDYKPKFSDRKIIINCLDESIDLRMTALMDLYRKACFDWPNRREVVPQNLRRFKVKVYCYEGRYLNRWGFPWSPGALGISGTIEAGIPPVLKMGKQEADKWFGKDERAGVDLTSGGLKQNLGEMFGRKKDGINDNISRVMYDFNYCEWLPDESNTLLSSISHKEFGLKAQRIAFSYENVEEDNIFRFFHEKKVSDSIIQTLDGLALDKPELLKDVPSFLGPYVAGAISRGVTELRDLLIGKLNDLLLGNVYGFQPLLAAQSIANGGIGGVIGAAREIGKNASKENATNDVVNGKAGENPYKDTQVNTTGPSTNVSLNNKNQKGFGAAKYFDDFFTPSLKNDHGSNPATSQGLPAQDPSLANDNGSDAKSQGLGQENASLSNDNGSDSKPQGLGPANPSLQNDKNSNSATSQGSLTLNTSLQNDKNSNPATSQGSPSDSPSKSNDNGPDAKSQGLGPSNASLQNDKNSNSATSQGSPINNTSLQNDKNSNPATSQGSPSDSPSKANDNGPDAKSQGLGPANASLSNAKNSKPATSQGSPLNNISLSNDNGPDAKSQGSPNGNASLSNG